MAYLDSMTDEERRQLEASGGGGVSPASSPGGGAAAPPPAAPSSGFQNLAGYFGANKDTAEAQGAGAVDSLQKDAVGAIFSDDPGKAMDVYGELGAAEKPDTLASVDQGGRSAGESRLDAYLSTRGAEPGAFQGLREKFGAPLLKVESPYAGPEVRAPLSFGQDVKTAIAPAADTTNAHTLTDKTINQINAAEQDRYSREMQPQRDWEARREANRTPFQDLYDYYYGKGAA